METFYSTIFMEFIESSGAGQYVEFRRCVMKRDLLDVKDADADEKG